MWLYGLDWVGGQDRDICRKLVIEIMKLRVP